MYLKQDEIPCASPDQSDTVSYIYPPEQPRGYIRLVPDHPALVGRAEILSIYTPLYLILTPYIPPYRIFYISIVDKTQKSEAGAGRGYIRLLDLYILN